MIQRIACSSPSALNNPGARPPSISNPLADAHGRLGLPPPLSPRLISRPLDITSADYGAIAMWSSNRAILSTMSRPEDQGVHVHAWSADGERVVDDTYSPVILDGDPIDEHALRRLAVQRTLADGAPIISLACCACGHSILSPSSGWLTPATCHTCDSCGAENRTRRRAFLNSLAT